MFFALFGVTPVISKRRAYLLEQQSVICFVTPFSRTGGADGGNRTRDAVGLSVIHSICPDDPAARQSITQVSISFYLAVYRTDH